MGPRLRDRAQRTATLIVAELAANAVRHGHVPGRDFHLSLSATRTTIRIEARTPARSAVRRSVTPNLRPRKRSRGGGGGPGKTIWAEVGTEGAGPP
jgi:anti-sigma regulatory factor (Ser/Thr protein kinase)